MFWNRSKLDALIEAEIPALRRFAMTLTRERDVADDLLQETLLAALSNWPSLRQPDRIKSWLFSILYRRFISDVRRDRRRGEHRPIDEATGFSAPATQEDALAHAQTLHMLEMLPEEQRIVIWLVAVDDLTYREVADMLGLPLGTIMSRLARGRERLRRLVGDDTVVSLRRAK